MGRYLTDWRCCCHDLCPLKICGRLARSSTQQQKPLATSDAAGQSNKTLQKPNGLEEKEGKSSSMAAKKSLNSLIVLFCFLAAAFFSCPALAPVIHIAFWQEDRESEREQENELHGERERERERIGVICYRGREKERKGERRRGKGKEEGGKSLSLFVVTMIESYL